MCCEMTVNQKKNKQYSDDNIVNWKDTIQGMVWGV